MRRNNAGLSRIWDARIAMTILLESRVGNSDVNGCTVSKCVLTLAQKDIAERLTGLFGIGGVKYSIRILEDFVTAPCGEYFKIPVEVLIISGVVVLVLPKEISVVEATELATEKAENTLIHTISCVNYLSVLRCQSKVISINLGNLCDFSRI